VTVRPRYLRVYDDDLDGALALVVHDVVATSALPAADARALVGYYAERRVRDLAPDSEAGGETAIWVAQAVQEQLLEGDAQQQPLVSWPACPHHPEHPLWLSTREPDRHDGDLSSSAWTCPTTHEQIAELGGL
jgi:hypothetical protein